MAGTPEWLNNEFLETALNSKGDNYKVVSSEIVRATAPGDNYASEIYRATIKVEKNGAQETLTVIIKSELQTKEMAKVVAEGNAFGREIDAFTLAIPSLTKLLDEAAPNKYKPYSAECYYTHQGPPSSVLVLEDLKLKGFRLADKGTELDRDHCFLFLRRLAAYQAASVVLFATDPDKIEPFKTTMFNENMRTPMEKIMIPLLRSLAKEAENWPECNEHIINKLKEITDSAFDHLVRCVQREDNVFNVIAHEDVWVNNMMFLYDEDTKKVKDIRLVDLQLYHWTSPAVDLVYFLNANGTIDVLENQHIFIDEYYKTLCETLGILGYSHLCPSKQYIYDEVEKRRNLGVLFGILARSVIFAEQGKAPNLEQVLLDKEDIALTEAFNKSMKQVLPIFHKRGWL